MAHADQPDSTTILIVEDNPVLLLHAANLLEDAGFDVIEAAHADAAIAFLEAGRAVSVVFTDIEMPGSMDGLRLAKAIRDRWPPVHLIVASGRFSPNSEEMPTGACFFAKPYDGALLVSTIQGMLRDGPPAAPPGH